MTRLAPLSLLLLVLGGCTTVRVPQPFGDTPLTLDPAEWNGTWCDPSTMTPTGDGALTAEHADCATITIVDAGAGIVDAVSTNDPDDRARAHLRGTAADPRWIAVSIEGHGDYQFGVLLRRQGDALVMWTVDGGAIKKAVEAGQLAGRVEGDEVILGSLDRPDLARLLDDDGRAFFEWREPGVLVRVNGGP